MEDDNLDGQFNENSEDMYSIEIGNLDAGWQHISLKYSDMAALVNGQPSDPSGNGLREANKLHNVRVLDLANPDTGYTQVYIDFIIFTEGAPLQP